MNIFSKEMKMLLRKCDFISPQIYLYYYTEKRHSSATSGFITLLFIFTTLMVSYYFSKDFFFRNNPTVFYYKKYFKNEENIYLNSSGVFHFINFFSEYNHPINIEKKAFTIIGIKESKESFIKNNNIINNKFWIYDLCEESDFGDLYQYISDNVFTLLNYSFCIQKFYDNETKTIILKNDSNFEYPFMSNAFSNLIYGVYFMHCQNFSLLNNNSCFDNDVILDYRLNTFKYSLNFIDYYVNVEDYYNPIKGSFNSLSTEFSTGTFSINHLNFANLELSTNRGHFIDKIKKIKTFSFDFNAKLIEYNMINSSFNIFGGYNFVLKNEINIYIRKYNKLQDIIGSINGALQMFLVMAEGLNYFFYHGYKIIVDFNHELFNIHLKNLKRSATFTDDSNYKFITPKLKKSNSSILGKIKMGKIKTVKILNEHSYKSIRSKTKIMTSLVVPDVKKDICWSEFFFNFRIKCFKREQYINFISLYRKKILSEEQIYKNYFKIKNLKSFVKLINNKNNEIKYGSNNGLLNIQKFDIIKNTFNN